MAPFRAVLALPLAALAVLSASGSQPAIEEIGSSKVTSRSAQVWAHIDPNGAKTEWQLFLEYKICQGSGVCTELWKQTEIGSGTIAAGQKAAAIKARARLSPGCWYEYHAVAVNRYGTSHTGEKPGEREREFMTPATRRIAEPHECEAAPD